MARPGGHSTAGPGLCCHPRSAPKAPFLVAQASPPVRGRASEAAFRPSVSGHSLWISRGR